MQTDPASIAANWLGPSYGRGVTRGTLGAMLLLAACSPAPQAHVTPPPKPPKLSLPGGCVAPESDARARLGPDAHDGALRVERIVDLDGDGITDPYVTHDVFCGTGGCRWQLYVERGPCGHHVGELFGMTPLPIAEVRDHGLLQLEVTVRQGCAGLARFETRVRFDGATYKAFQTRACTCPKEDDPPGDQCAEWKDLP